MFFLDTPKVEKQKSDFEILPKGWYRALITSSEGKDTQAGTGRYLSLCFDIIAGEYKGRKVWNIFNIKNPNEMAVKIGLSDLKTLAEALGHPSPFKLEGDYHKFVKDRVVQIKIGQRKDTKSGELKNSVQDYRSDESDLVTASDDSGADEIPF